MNNIEIINETEQYVFFRGYYKGNEVIFVHDKRNPENFIISGDSIAKVLGYGCFDEMMSDDKMLDKMNQYMKETGNTFPLNPIELGNTNLS